MRVAPNDALSTEGAVCSVVSDPPGKETCTMSMYVNSRSRSEDQIWEHLDRMRDAGPVADYYFAAHEGRAWATATSPAARSGTSFIAVTATMCWRWIGPRLKAIGRRLEGTSPAQTLDADRFLTTQHHLAN